MNIRHEPGAGDAQEDPSSAGATSDSDASTHTAFSKLAPRDRNPGDTWGGLRIVDLLGRGGFGCVYRAWDETLAREVALKILRVPSSAPDLASEVLNEGRLLARVRHRNIVTVYGAQQIGDEVGLWMELVHGRSLSDIVRQDGPMGAEEAIVIGSSLARALAAVHGAGLLHRDVKANNVMREAGGRIVLMDFGAGRDVAPAVRAARGDLAGTPIYMAPEVLIGHPAAAAADLYSLGVLLFFLVTGRFPVEGRSVPEVLLSHSQGRRLLADLRPDLPDAFVRVVERALSADPALRYQSAGAMLRELMEAAGDSREPAEAFPGITPGSISAPTWTPRTPYDVWPTESAPSQATPASVTRGWIWAAAAAGVTLVLWILGFLMSVEFDQSLGRSAEFSSDTPFTWLAVGLESLVAPVLYALLAMIVIRIGASTLMVVRRLVPPLGKVSHGLQVLGLAWASPSVRGQVLVVLQVVSVVLVWVAFRDLIAAFTAPIDTADPAALRPLNRATNQPNVYRSVLTLLLLAMAAAWYQLWVKQPPGLRPDRATITAGVAAIVVVLLMLEVPYRIVYGSEFLSVEYNGMRCYVLGETPARKLLHCPASSPSRNLVVDQNDPRVVPVGGVEPLFYAYR